MYEWIICKKKEEKEEGEVKRQARGVKRQARGVKS